MNLSVYKALECEIEPMTAQRAGALRPVRANGVKAAAATVPGSVTAPSG